MHAGRAIERAIAQHNLLRGVEYPRNLNAAVFLCCISGQFGGEWHGRLGTARLNSAINRLPLRQPIELPDAKPPHHQCPNDNQQRKHQLPPAKKVFDHNCLIKARRKPHLHLCETSPLYHCAWARLPLAIVGGRNSIEYNT